MAAPYAPYSPGRGEECVQTACEQVQLVWANNPAAVAGVISCLLALWCWISLRPRPEEAEDEHG